MTWRPLTEAEKWSGPFFSRHYGVSIKLRRTCQAPHNQCVANATVLLGRKRLCRTHLRIALRGMRKAW